MAIAATEFETLYISGDKVTISDPAFTTSGGYVDRSFFGKVGEVVRLRNGYKDEWEVSVNGDTNFIGGKYLNKVEPTQPTELDKLLQDLLNVREELVKVRTETASQLRTLKEQFRESLYSASEDAGDFDVFDVVTEALGLEGRERDFSVTVNVNGSLTYTVSANSEDAAQETVDRYSLQDAISNYGISGFIDDFEVTTVEED